MYVIRDSEGIIIYILLLFVIMMIIIVIMMTLMLISFIALFHLSIKVLKFPKQYDVVKNFSMLSYVTRIVTLRKVLIMCIQCHSINIARMCIVHIVMVKSSTIQVASLHHLHLLLHLQRLLNQYPPPPHYQIPLHLKDKEKEEEDSFL